MGRSSTVATRSGGMRDSGLADQAARLIQQSARFLEYTLSTFSGGTDPTQRHTRTVEKIARMVLSDEFLAALSFQRKVCRRCHIGHVGILGILPPGRCTHRPAQC